MFRRSARVRRKIVVGVVGILIPIAIVGYAMSSENWKREFIFRLLIMFGIIIALGVLGLAIGLRCPERLNHLRPRGPYLSRPLHLAGKGTRIFFHLSDFSHSSERGVEGR